MGITPYLSVFVTMNLYRGGREIERTMVIHEKQGFLDRSEPPEA
jgi:hypothetical protein